MPTPFNAAIAGPIARLNPLLKVGTLWLVLAGAGAGGLWHLRQDAIDSQFRELALLSLALTDEIDRGLRGTEEGARALGNELAERRLPLGGAQASLALRTRADLMPLVSALWLLDKQGDLLAASQDAAPPDASGFAPALDRLAKGTAAISRASADTPALEASVSLAVPFNDPSGQAHRGGWVIAAMPASTLLGAFNAALPGADARMAVFRSDGERLAGAGMPIAAHEASESLHRLDSRHPLEIRRFEDGSDNLVAVQKLPRYNIHVVVSRDMRAVLDGWRQAAVFTATTLALLLCVMVAAVHFVKQANRRRSEAQLALQTQLSRASKLQSLGTLAGGVAHDFNNVLAGIVGYGEMAQDAAEPGSNQARHIDKVLQAALRGKGLVERILAFSRGGAKASLVFELEPVVEEALGLLSGSLRPGIVLERALQAPAGRLRGDPTQAFEAVMNLCTNAMQAMPDGGMLTVELVREQVVAARVLSHSALAPGGYLVLSVTDQGGGITPAVMEHLFEPFFTTKAAQSGTGLGLAVVHGVVTEMGGAIHVKSSPGAGARFTLYLPECTEALGEGSAADAEPARGHGQVLLVVDDEAGLVDLTVEMLTELGYAPEGCGNALEALQRLRERPQHYAGVVTDEVMPGMTGTQLTTELRSFAPQLPVLLVSGWGGALLAQRAAEAGVSRVLTKPLQRSEMSRVLADLLR